MPRSAWTDAVGLAEGPNVNRNHRERMSPHDEGAVVMCVTSSGDSCHVRERSLFHREKSAKTARIDPAAANPSIARP